MTNNKAIELPVDVVKVDKAQKEIDYWHDKAQSYEQTILKLSLNKAEDAVEVVRCKNCKYNAKGDNESEFWNICTLRPRLYVPVSDEDYCSRGETKDE